jgi:hypothetical protein
MNRHDRRANASRRRAPTLANIKAEIERNPERRANFAQDAEGFDREMRETLKGLAARGVMKTTLSPDDDQTPMKTSTWRRSAGWMSR